MRKFILPMLCLFLILIYSSCSKTENTVEILTKGREFEEWWDDYGLPYAVTFSLDKRPDYVFDSETGIIKEDAYNDQSAYYLAYHTLLAKGKKFKDIYGDRVNWEGDKETVVLRQAVPASQIHDTIAKLYGLNSAEKSSLKIPNEYLRYNPDTTAYEFIPDFYNDDISGAQFYADSLPLKEVRIDNTVSPATATLVISHKNGNVDLNSHITYQRSGGSWRLISCNIKNSSQVVISDGSIIEAFGGLNAHNVYKNYLRSITTNDGILLFLLNDAISGLDLIHINSSGKVLATGQIPDIIPSENFRAYIIDSMLFINNGTVTYTGGLDLSRFIRHEVKDKQSNGEIYSAVLMPDLSTWYYVNDEGIFKYNSLILRRNLIAINPLNLNADNSDDAHYSDEYYRNIYLASSGNMLIAPVYGYEWQNGAHVIDISGTKPQKSTVDVQMLFGGGSILSDDYYIFKFTEITGKAKTLKSIERLGAYSYNSGEYLDFDISGMNWSISGPIISNSAGNIIAFSSSDGNADYIYKAELPSKAITEICKIGGAKYKIAGIFPTGEIVIVYGGYEGASGFIIA